MRRIVGFVAAVVVAVGGGWAALGGHTLGHYPSYYPDEIRIDTIDPAGAAKGLGEKTLHAYIGAAPAFKSAPAEHVKAVTSLGAFLVLDMGAGAKRFAAGERCAAAGAAMAALSRRKADGFVFHPYPVTPYHADYIHHLDRVEDALTRTATGGGITPSLAAKGRLAEALAGNPAATGGDAVLEEVPVEALIAGNGVQVDGWLGPPWIKEGWFQAYRLLSPGLAGDARRTADEAYRRLLKGEHANLAGQANLERRLIAALTRDCRRLVVGYGLRREYLNDETAEGIENVAIDSVIGLNAPMFLRTVKLKDYPWNGSLHLGVPAGPAAAWNPIGGFNDPAGRLIWQALGDAAVIPFPFNASWTPNRVLFQVTSVRGQSGGIKVPVDALRPETGSGLMRPAGPGGFVSAKVVYDVVASPYLDGSETEVADLLYPYAFLYRWGADSGKHREPSLAGALANIRDRLAGLKVLRVESVVKTITPGFDVVQKTPVFSVYLRDAPGDDHQVAALAPPWSTVPWQLMALMEEAVVRGYAAFSREEAARLGVPWLDLARDPQLIAKLKALAAELEKQKFIPRALKDLVSADEAAGRWRGLRAFAAKNGHFLITNGPYRLKSWSAEATVLKAVREATYPLGFGTFDRYVEPPRAVIQEAARDTQGIVVRADADITVKVARHYEVKREPLTRNTSHGLYPVLVVSRYDLIGPKGDIVSAGKMTWLPDNQFRVPLPAYLPPGRYAALVGIFLDGNTVLPSTRVVRFAVGGN